MSTVLDTNVTADVPRTNRRAGPPRKKHDVATMRVLHLINGEHYAGAERVQDLLASAYPISASNPQSPASNLADSPQHAGRNRLRCINCRCGRDGTSGRPGAWPGCLRHERFDILHTHTPRAQR